MLVNTDLVKLLDALAGLNTIVIGEAMLDCYLSGVANRLCQEAPVPVVTVTDSKQVPGGAANTAVNVHTLGGLVTFLSAIGDDWEGAILRQALEEQGVSTKHVFTQPGRLTLAKQRVISSSQLLVRFDQGSTDAIESETEQKLIDELERCFPDCDAVIVSDYGYGILTSRVIQAIAKLQQSSPRILVVDSKNLTAYRHVGVTAVKPNYNEAVELLGLEALDATTLPERNARPDQIATHGERLLDLTGAQIAAVTLDVEGTIVFERDRKASPAEIRPCYRTYARPANHSRASGAGDTFVSALTLALAASAPTSVATDLASVAAAVVVGKEGTTACSVQELREMLLMPSLQAPDKYVPDPSALVARVASKRASGHRIVFTNGCFDILHAGHVSYLNRARELGDILVIGVNSDVSVSRLKGSSRPVNPLEDRIQVLSALRCVDYLVPFDDDTPSNLIHTIRPDVYVKGGDYTKETLPEALLVEKLGGVVQILPFVENRSTTSIIERICKAQLENKGF
jgi:D-beta-D-heptose 7-phosphate kinase/D-beta-D-heptose 1-phosphate adenosyltransferase